MYFGRYLAVCAAALFWLQAGRAATVTTLHNFGPPPDGKWPVADLLVLNGQLYGATQLGGQGCNGEGCGTVFSVDPVTGAERILHDFYPKHRGAKSLAGYSPQTGLVGDNAVLFGSTSFYGTLFRMNPVSGHVTVLEDLSTTTNQFVTYGSRLIGTSKEGGKNTCNAIKCGSIYAFDRKTGVYSVLYSFAGTPDGNYPQSKLLKDGSHLFGTTSYGGRTQHGTLFMFDPDSGKYRLLHSFVKNTTGAFPQGGLVKSGDMLYGVTGEFGPHGDGGRGGGTVWRLDMHSHTMSVLHVFSETDSGGEGPQGLTLFNGLLYGMTYSSQKGKAGGTIFTVDPASGAFQVIYTFDGRAGYCSPVGDLVPYGGLLYGITYFCGTGGGGTVFSLTP